MFDELFSVVVIGLFDALLYVMLTNYSIMERLKSHKINIRSNNSTILWKVQRAPIQNQFKNLHLFALPYQLFDIGK